MVKRITRLATSNQVEALFNMEQLATLLGKFL